MQIGWSRLSGLLDGTPLAFLRHAFLSFGGKTAHSLSFLRVFLRLRVGLIPYGEDTLPLHEVDETALQASELARVFSETCFEQDIEHKGPYTWEDWFRGTRYPEIAINPRYSFQPQAYVEFAENIPVPIGSDYMKSLCIQFVPHTRCFLPPSFEIPPGIDLTAGDPQWRHLHKSWFEVNAPTESSTRKACLPCRGWQTCPPEIYWKDADGVARGGY